VSGSPIPRLITSTPAARLAAIFCSSCANRYGGICSRRLLGCMQLLDEVIGQAAAEHGQSPAAQIDVQILSYLDLELAAVQHHGDRRISAAQHGGAPRT